MSGLFGIINLGLSALTAHRSALNTHSHNLANVDTPGYSRQDAVLTSNPSAPPAGSISSLIGGQFGTGVQVTTVRRLHEAFLGVQSRMFQASLGGWGSRLAPLREAESVLSPGPGEDLSALLDRFWDAWESVANRPEDLALRSVLRENAVTLCDVFRSSVQRLQAVRTSIDGGVAARVQEVNSLAAETAEYNRQMSVAQAERRAPNDLLDKRDLLLDRLAALCGAVSFNSQEGHLIIHPDGRPLIQGASAFPLSVATTATGMVIRSSYDGATVQITSGEIGGLLEARDVVIPDYLSQLDALAGALIAEVNSRHRAGFGLDDITDRDFFVAGATAGDIEVEAAILADVRAIGAAASAGAPGDGSVALDIANLRTTPAVGALTLGQLAQALLGSVGEDIERAESEVRVHEAALGQIQEQQQAAAGVSIDEELAYLTQSQRAYEAAARVITAADEMLRTVIERMGAS